MYDFSLPPGRALPEMPVPACEPHFFYGSTLLAKRLEEDAQWAFGQLQQLGLLDPAVWSTFRGADMLNERFHLLSLGELRAAVPHDAFFVRPAVEQKAFAGQVVRGGDLSGLYVGSRGDRREHSDSLMVCVSPLQDIRAEYRFLVHNHQVMLGSRYKLDDELSTCSDIPVDVFEVAQQLAQGWQPARLSVMDVAILPGNVPKIVEFNSVHSSGLYAMDLKRVATVIEVAVHEHFGSDRFVPRVCGGR